MTVNKWVIAAFAVALVAILGGGIYLMSKQGGGQDASSSNQTLIAKYHWKKYPDLGRNHVSDGTHVTYNSNPPTSGPHYPEWQTYGILTKPVADEHLVHSLEHGYIIMSYNCAKLPKGTTCDQLKQELTGITKDKRIWKMIVIPRPSLDVPLALTAWDYLAKMKKFDKTEINAFIDTFRDKGPEQTIE